MTKILDDIWYNDFNIIIEHPMEFFPSKDMSNNERMNAFVRLSLYISVLLCLYHKKYVFLYIFVGVLILTYYISNNNVENFTQETLPKKCKSPSIANPFMNTTMEDYLNTDKDGKIINPGELCQDLKYMKKDIDEKFNNNLYNDVDDLFGKNNSQRQFYTANTELIPDMDGNFKNWLYKPSNDNVKNNLFHNDLRRSRSNNIFYNDYENPTKI